MNLKAVDVNKITGNCATKIVFEWEGSKKNEEVVKQLMYINEIIAQFKDLLLNHDKG